MRLDISLSNLRETQSRLLTEGLTVVCRSAHSEENLSAMVKLTAKPVTQHTPSNLLEKTELDTSLLDDVQ